MLNATQTLHSIRCAFQMRKNVFFACGRRKNGTERWWETIKDSQWKEGNRQNRIRWMDGMQYEG